MKTHQCIVLATIQLAASIGYAETVSGGIELISTGLVSPDTGVVFDVYHVVIDNDLGDATWALFSFPGEYVNEGPSFFRSAFRTELDLTDGVPDSFFFLDLPLIPTGFISVEVVDTESELAASYTIAGTTPVAPSGTRPVAVLTTPTGVVPDVGLFSGLLVVNGEAVVVRFVPEPSGAVLHALVLVSAALRRTCA